jgi:hypothetical protein
MAELSRIAPVMLSVRIAAVRPAFHFRFQGKNRSLASFGQA